MDASRLGEQLFERYPDERGSHWEHHPGRRAEKQPDYLVDAEGVRIVCEARTSNNDGLVSITGARIGIRSMDQVLTPQRDHMKKNR